MASILQKVIKLIFERPTVFFSYLRQTYLFFQTRFLMRIFLRKSASLIIEKNVRFQSLKNLVREPNAKFFIGENSIVYENARLESLDKAQLLIGKNSIIGDARITSRSSITIGSHFLTSWNVFISDFDAHPVDPVLRESQMNSMVTNFYPSFDHKVVKTQFEWQFTCSPIVIGSNVWVGANVSILKGAKIGDNCIIASGAVVTKGDYPNNSILAGNPAKIVKTLV